MIQTYTATPDQFPGGLLPDRQRTSDPWGMSKQRTLAHLEAELRHLGTTDLRLGLMVPVDKVRRDGWPHANAVVPPPVIVDVPTSKHGPLRYVSQRYDHWVANVHAVGLTLERLRAVDRYGCAAGGEQYTGWAALPAGGPTPIAAPPLMGDPALVLAEYLGWTTDKVRAVPASAWVEVRKLVHPDRHGGDRTAWDRCADAAAALGVAV